jgi:hypothetical protein
VEHDYKVTYTKESVERLREGYKEAVACGKNEFVFDGKEYVTDYAKYMLEYLEGVFSNEK